MNDQESLSNKVDQLVKKHRELTERKDQLVQNKNRIEAELKVNRRALEQTMNEAREEGFDPNNLKEELQREAEAVQIKLNVLQGDIEAGEKIVEPILKVIESNA